MCHIAHHFRRVHAGQRGQAVRGSRPARLRPRCLAIAGSLLHRLLRGGPIHPLLRPAHHLAPQGQQDRLLLTVEQLGRPSRRHRLREAEAAFAVLLLLRRLRAPVLQAHEAVVSDALELTDDVLCPLSELLEPPVHRLDLHLHAFQLQGVHDAPRQHDVADAVEKPGDRNLTGAVHVQRPEDLNHFLDPEHPAQALGVVLVEIEELVERHGPRVVRVGRDEEHLQVFDEVGELLLVDFLLSDYLVGVLLDGGGEDDGLHQSHGHNSDDKDQGDKVQGQHAVPANEGIPDLVQVVETGHGQQGEHCHRQVGEVLLHMHLELRVGVGPSVQRVLRDELHAEDAEDVEAHAEHDDDHGQRPRGAQEAAQDHPELLHLDK
mmetsp:Transcript_66772/g.195968  ORF Transcript_66772/g.195968 Transcript_66772/m.195968 type:complete len:376 (+) Transcript_66772:166-1293(+)